MKVRIVYNTAPLPEFRIKTLSSWRKIADSVDVVFTFPEAYQRSLVDRLSYRLGVPNDPGQINRRLVELQASDPADLVFFVKGVYIRPGTVQRLKKMEARCVFWSNDDMWGRHNRNVWFSRSARHYDLVVTQKSYNCDPGELPSLGAKVLFQDKAFDPALHYPVPGGEDAFRHSVLFIGTNEKQRRDSLITLAAHGVAVDIYGWGEQAATVAHPGLHFHARHLYGRDYAAAFSSATISLNFLRKQSRDLQTGRSVEIPACGGFMLAERTNEHLRLFSEGVEAEYFDSDEELLEKVQYYLGHPDEASEIAQRACERAHSGGYSFDDRMRDIVEHVM